METIKLYDINAYDTEFTARVIGCEELRVEDRTLFGVVLDRTLFFPEEGGQTPDKGTLESVNVLDVGIKENIITHYTDSPLEVGTEVHGKIDFAHRYSNMQQHSGEHIFSGTVNRLFGFDNVGFHLSDNSVTMDFNGVLSPEDLKQVEDEVNKAIYENLEIKAYYPEKEELDALEYRSKKELKGPVRIVIVPGYDICACCAPHVKRTGEIGMLKIISVKNYKGGVRINILCGKRALDYYRESLDLIDSLTALLTTGRENLFENIKALKTEVQSLSSKLAGAKSELLMNELSKFPETENDVFFFSEKTDSFIMRNCLNKLMEKHAGLCAFFSGSEEEGWTYFLGSRTLDSREAQKKLASIGARGGGKPEMVSGSLGPCSPDKIKNALS